LKLVEGVGAGAGAGSGDVKRQLERQVKKLLRKNRRAAEEKKLQLAEGQTADGRRRTAELNEVGLSS
jgi:hypothetical protein